MNPHARTAHRPPLPGHDALFDDPFFREHYLQFVAACIGPVENYDALRQLVRHQVRALLPHRMTVIAIGRTSFNKILIDHLISIDFPDNLIQQQSRQLCLAERPVIERWLQTGKPVLIAHGDDSTHLSERERREFRDFNLGPMAVNGHVDMSGRMASYYSFCQVEDLSERSGLILELITPHLQMALMKAHQAETVDDRRSLLTRKEHEILHWIVLGKTNREIATILSKSELTVRNQVHCILCKLQASTRAEAAQKADEMGLLAQWQNVKARRTAVN